jgi:hypothetical protein
MWAEPSRYELYVGTGNEAPFNSTVTTPVDARSGSRFTADIQVQPASAVVQGRVRSATPPNASLTGAIVTLGLPSQVQSGATIGLGGVSTFGSGALFYVPVAPATYSLDAYMPGYKRPPPTNVVAPILNDIILTPYPVRITGRVLSGSSPIAGVWPSGWGQGNCSSQAPFRSDAGGNYTFYADACQYEMWVYSYGYGFHSTPATGTTVVDARSGGILSGINLPVKPASATLSGGV